MQLMTWPAPVERALEMDEREREEARVLSDLGDFDMGGCCSGGRRRERVRQLDPSTSG